MALSLFKRKAAGTVGLDIDGRFLAAVEVAPDGRLARVASAELPDGVLVDGEVADREALSEALKDFVAKADLPREVRLGVSNQQIVVRMLELPQIEDEDERRAALRFQAADAIAMPLDEAVLDHQVAGFVTNGEGVERMQVVVVAARRAMIDEYLAAAKDAGLKPEGIDLDAFALVRMLMGQTLPGNGADPSAPDGAAASAADTEPLVPDALPLDTGAAPETQVVPLDTGVESEPDVVPLDTGVESEPEVVPLDTGVESEPEVVPLDTGGEPDVVALDTAPEPELQAVPLDAGAEPEPGAALEADDGIPEAAAADAPAPVDPAAPPMAVPAPPGDPADEPEPPQAARVYCHLGGVSNLAIAVGPACYFTRTLSTRFDAPGAGASLADEIRLSIDYYMGQPNALPVGDALLSGEGARDGLLVADIGAQLGVPVAAATPLGALDAAVVAQDDDPRRYTVAAGLAIGDAA